MTMNNLDNIGVDELDYDIQNHIKISWNIFAKI
jgi:hypothetical protein